MEQNCPNYRQRRRGSRAGHPTRKLAKFLNGLYSSTVYKPFKKYWCVESMKALPRGALSRLSFQMTNRATILECQSYRLRYRLREEESLGFLWNLQKYVQGNPKQTGTFEMLKLTEKCLE